MPYINVFGVPHAYTLTTKNVDADKTIVFVHGWLLSQRYWQPVVQSLQSDCQCLSYDLRGFGASNAYLEQRYCDIVDCVQKGAAYTLEAYAQDLGRLLESLNLSKVWLVGHSLGGSVALWAAKLLPHRVAGVICVNAGGGVYLPDEFRKFRQAGQQIIRWRPFWLAHLPLIGYAFARLMVAKPLGTTWGKQRVLDLLAADEAAALGALLDSTTEEEVHLLPQVVANLQQPVYFIAGLEDTVMEEQYVQHLASFHDLFESPEGNVIVLPECGHMAMVEQPIALSQTIQAIVKTRPVASQPQHQLSLSQSEEG
ncbi:MAG: alpha/beta hydrolase [Cyanobacteria bacterium P01_F01_bin.86]